MLSAGVSEEHGNGEVRTSGTGLQELSRLSDTYTDTRRYISLTTHSSSVWGL
jgi:hypothetical protein